MEEAGKQLHSRSQMMAHKKSIVGSTVMRLKAKEIYDHVIQGSESAKRFLAWADWLTSFKK